MSRLRSKIKHSASLQATQVDDSFLHAIVNVFAESKIEEFKNSNFIEKIPQEKREEFFKFIKEDCKMYQNVRSEYDFLINPIMDIINKSDYYNFGARRLDKIISRGIENNIIEAIINNDKEIFLDKLNEYEKNITKA